MSKAKTIIYVAAKSTYRAVVPKAVNPWLFGGQNSLSRVVLRVKQWMERGVAHDGLYDDVYFAAQDSEMRHSARIIASTIVEQFAPSRVADVGCGSGAVLAELRRLGCDVWGCDYAQAAIESCLKKGLVAHRFDLESEGAIPEEWLDYADVVVSTEVAEHLPADCADRYVRLLAQITRRWIVITAATPGQGGTDHVNEQPHSYWVEKFASQGARCCLAESESMRQAWSESGVNRSRARNVLIFEKT